jgi:hypothetical protein
LGEGLLRPNANGDCRGTPLSAHEEVEVRLFRNRGGKKSEGKIPGVAFKFSSVVEFQGCTK